MLLGKIVKNLDFLEVKGALDLEINSICYDSRKANGNCLYVPLEGNNCNGHDYIKEAVACGAVAVLSSVREIGENFDNTTFVYVKNTRKALAFVSANFFCHPADRLKVIGITGTKGKTTAASMVASILNQSQIKTAVVGTIGVISSNGNVVKLNNTTPESYELQKYMRQMLNENYECVILEISSLGIKHHRTDAIEFDIGCFTNFSRDHIGQGEHKDMKEYLACKAMLFSACKTGIFNIDDNDVKKVYESSTCEKIKFGFSKHADFIASNLSLITKPDCLGTKFELCGQRKMIIDVAVPGSFSVYNALLAISTCCKFNDRRITDKNIKIGLKKAKTKGRVEVIDTPFDYSLIIDFAHNAVSMKNILKTLRKYTKNQLIIMFGSGGERSKTRRYDMGKIAGKLSDFVVITSDNPRSEPPLDIIDDIKSSIAEIDANYAVFPDRKDAIRYCMNIAKKGDIVILAGKGHEDYQFTSKGKEHFDEREVIASFIKEFSKNQFISKNSRD
ncbi:MAG: UDP-N-acetylmuramoyl-L-alanyl-D-glutamate--2,6-diaminopimelate ligase [Oscillospiraceae bacterium]|nr:UDP-N-acetylmuramoyl-L-alanyl-D-glutamate--2,6-diaminopimelate ligase [Oscillospiraceae bacterium]